VARTLVLQLQSVRWSEIHFSPWLVVASFLVCLTGRTLPAVSYRIMFRSFGPSLSWAQSATVSWLPALGKYLPGKVASLVGAFWLLRRSNVSTGVAAAAIFVLHVLMVLVAMILAAPLLLWQPVRQRLPLAWLWLSLVLLAGIVCLHPRVFTAVSGFLLRKLKQQKLPSLPGLRGYAAPAVVMAIRLSLVGTALWLLCRSITPLCASWIPLLVSGWSLAGTVGFLAVFAPGGIGVREGILLLLLAPAIGAPNAAIVVVAFRIIQVLVEVLLFLCALKLMKLHPAAPAPTDDGRDGPGR